MDGTTKCAPCRSTRHDSCTGHGCECQCGDLPDLRWEQPPKPMSSSVSRRLTIPDDVRAALRFRAGTWARLQDYPKANGASSRATQWKRLYGADGFEFCGRKIRNDDGELIGSALYARYVGKATAVAS